MISNALIKHIRSLHQAKFRDEYKQFIAEGVKVVDELLKSPYKLLYLCASSEWLAEQDGRFAFSGVEVSAVSPAELERISTLSTPNKVLAVFQKPEAVELPVIKEGELLLALDAIRDPGNLGTIIRIADWFGIRNVICSDDCVDLYNPKTVQATMGSLVRVDLHYTELENFLKQLPSQLAVFASDMQGENIYQATLPAGGVILIGSESHGLSVKLQDVVSRKLFIPPFGEGPHAESLNASVAAGIVVGEFRRRVNNE
jgi:TrmH family RNA methyltransferase